MTQHAAHAAVIADGPGGDVPVRSAFVGRESELSRLRTALADAAAGRGQLALLVGEAGIGKTRLANEVAGLATRQGARALWGRCWEGEGAPAFWPWVQVVRAYAAALAPDTLREALGHGAPDIARVVPELRECLSDLPEVANSC
jgi:predicted ATPase